MPGQPGQPRLLRQLNDRTALTLLLDRGPLSRNEIASLTGLSKPTAAEIIRRLETAGVITEVDAASPSGRRGPNAALYAVDVSSTIAVAIDIQLVDVRSTVVDATGAAHPLVAYRMSPDEARADAAEIIEAAIARAADAAGIDPESVTAAAVGVQASVDHASDSLIFTDVPGGWPRDRVAETLSSALGLRVVLENDANLAAIAERRIGVGRASSSFALFWVAEGIGLALDIGGRVHSGASGAAGETGYLSVPRDALALEPGADTVADLISEDAVVRLALAHDVIANASAAAAATGHFPTPDHDAWLAVLERMPHLEERHPFLLALGERLGHNVLPALAVADPETVIVHGPVGVAGGAALAAATTAWLRTRTRWSTAVVAPGVEVAPALRGAGFVLVDLVREALVARATDGESAATASATPTAPTAPTAPTSSTG
ncbi:ROK family transcriptional regulator [Schumannella luteola]